MSNCQLMNGCSGDQIWYNSLALKAAGLRLSEWQFNGQFLILSIIQFLAMPMPHPPFSFPFFFFQNPRLHSMPNAIQNMQWFHNPYHILPLEERCTVTAWASSQGKTETSHSGHYSTCLACLLLYNQSATNRNNLLWYFFMTKKQPYLFFIMTYKSLSGIGEMARNRNRSRTIITLAPLPDPDLISILPRICLQPFIFFWEEYPCNSFFLRRISLQL